MDTDTIEYDISVFEMREKDGTAINSKVLVLTDIREC